MSLRRRLKARREASKANIDMNSLIDLTFLLLVVFIVTLPQLEGMVDIVLPSDKVEERKKNEKEPIVATVNVDMSGKIFLGSAPITYDALKAEFEKKVAEDAERYTVIVRGDTRAGYGDVYEIFKLARHANVKHMSLAVVDK